MPVQFCTICTGKIWLEKRAEKGFEKSSEISSAFVIPLNVQVKAVLQGIVSFESLQFNFMYRYVAVLFYVDFFFGGGDVFHQI